MALRDLPAIDLLSRLAKKMPDTGHPVSNGLIRGLTCAVIVVLCMGVAGSVARCAAVAGSAGSGQPAVQVSGGDGEALLQPGDDVPNGETRLDPIVRSKVMTAYVTAVVDGDTVEMDNGGGDKRFVRMIGIDAPDAAHPDPSRNTAAGAEAKRYLETILPAGTQVWLTRDMSDTDHYGRVLAYVWLREPDGADPETDMVNALMVKSGHAVPLQAGADGKYSELFERIASGGSTSPVPSDKSGGSSDPGDSVASRPAPSSSEGGEGGVADSAEPAGDGGGLLGRLDGEWVAAEDASVTTAQAVMLGRALPEEHASAEPVEHVGDRSDGLAHAFVADEGGERYLVVVEEDGAGGVSVVLFEKA